MAISRYWAIALALALTSTGMGQTSATDKSAEKDKAQAMPSLTKLKHYGGDLGTRSTLLGDWGGKRDEWAAEGITFDIDITQILQGNAHGGKDTNNAFRYSGSADYTLILDTARMGLWPAGQLKLMGETQFGKSINSKVGSVMAVNSDALFPVPDDPGITTLTDVVYTQFFSEYFGIEIGRVDFRGGDANVFAHDERTQFMNLALVANPIILPYAPYTAMTGTIILRPTDWLLTAFTMLDTHSSPTETGFNTAFHSPEGTTFVNEWTANVKPFGLPGHQRFGLVYSTKDFTQLDQDNRILGPLSKIHALVSTLQDPETRPDDWGFYYNFDQYVFTEKEDPTQGVGVFGRFGWSSGETNPFETFYSLGAGGKGVIPERDHDKFGVGYYFLDMSDNLPSFLEMGSEQGVEVYYNIEITPWLHLTPDLQVIIDPGGTDDNDVAIVYGLRMQMNL